MLIVSYFAQLNLQVLLSFDHLKNLRLLNTRNSLNNVMLIDSDAIPSQLSGLSSRKSAKNRSRKGSQNWKILLRKAKNQTRHKEKHLMQTKKKSPLRSTSDILKVLKQGWCLFFWDSVQITELILIEIR